MVSDTAVAWWLTMPAIVTYLVMILIPTLAVLALAFTDYDFGAPSFNWIGLDNFAEMLGDRKFRAAISNTALYCLFVVPLSIGIALMLAVLIEAGSRGRALFRAIWQARSQRTPQGQRLFWLTGLLDSKAIVKLGTG